MTTSEDSTIVLVQEAVSDKNKTPFKKNVTKVNSEQDEEDELIRENEYVFIQMPSGNIKVVKLQKDTTVSLGKFGTFHSNDIIGRHFGHSYEIYEGDKVKVIRNIAYTKVDETDANNRDIMDDPSKQKLSYTDIEKLKKEGMEGQKSIFIYSRFSRIFTPLKPTLYSVWEYFFRKNPGKIREMRIDTLSQILSLANVHANLKILVVDDTQGLVISGVMERLGGYGIVLGIHDNENHNYDIVRYMNFSTKANDSLRVLSWQQVLEKDEVPFNEVDETTLSENDRKGYNRRKAVYNKLKETKQLLLNGEFDGQYQPESILETLVQYVAGSRPIVIYHINKEVLVNTCVQMRLAKHYLNPQITESWLRDYQVLPGRTHPEMSTTGGGGYILSTTRIIIDQSLPSSSTFTNNTNDTNDNDNNNEAEGNNIKVEKTKIDTTTNNHNSSSNVIIEKNINTGDPRPFSGPAQAPRTNPQGTLPEGKQAAPSNRTSAVGNNIPNTRNFARRQSKHAQGSGKMLSPHPPPCASHEADRKD
ncbi:5795_t:CDS:10 [Ambispora leptoticha]|uniref:tRNA (adenine(58)-N(1))-methyltransferase non-catalytic subunit TRM6 n=1 Tax=Ambispora leptoticha TaxID=144679 RepID=A0A9N8ZIN4_9GLOM|nr:5795_t:CDS:10 [Ambispora leptoticha]